MAKNLVPRKPPHTSITAAEQAILNRANEIRRRNSPAGKRATKLAEVEHYAIESSHSIPKKIETLTGWLNDAKDPKIKEEIQRQIVKLKG
ncbi:MAG: hypothetical protein NUV57_00410 [archaeon]|nr:hypothetical protein [archaeon]